MSKKILVAACLQADIIDALIEYYSELLGDEIDFWCLPGISRQILEQPKFFKQITFYDEVYLNTHSDCGYYNNLGFIGQNNTSIQFSDVGAIGHKLDEYNKQENKEIILNHNHIHHNLLRVNIYDSEFEKIFSGPNCPTVLVYPVEHWQSCFKLIKDTLNHPKFDRYGYFIDGPANISTQIESIVENIIEISINHHKTSRIILLTNKNHDRIRNLEKILEIIKQKTTQTTAAIFAISEINRKFIYV